MADDRWEQVAVFGSFWRLTGPPDGDEAAVAYAFKDRFGELPPIIEAIMPRHDASFNRYTVQCPKCYVGRCGIAKCRDRDDRWFGDYTPEDRYMPWDRYVPRAFATDGLEAFMKAVTGDDEGARLDAYFTLGQRIGWSRFGVKPAVIGWRTLSWAYGIEFRNDETLTIRRDGKPVA